MSYYRKSLGHWAKSGEIPRGNDLRTITDATTSYMRAINLDSKVIHAFFGSMYLEAVRRGG
jgi:hypothetical protein